MLSNDEKTLIEANLGSQYFEERLDAESMKIIQGGALSFPQIVQLINEQVESSGSWNRSLFLLRGVISQPGLTNAEYEWAAASLLSILLAQRDPRRDFLQGLLDILENHPSKQTLESGGNPQFESLKKKYAALERAGKNAWFPRARLCVNSKPYVMSVLDLAAQERTSLEQDSTFYVLGTCFAINIHNVLQSKGVNSTHYAHSENMPVEVVFSSRMLEDEAFTGAIQADPHPCLILTLGFAEFKLTDMDDDESQETSFHDYDVFRSPEYIAEAILKGARELRKLNENIRIFLTVSPVPLEGTSSGLNVFEANAISKSIVRLATAIACKQDASLQYFPSYEIVTQLAPSAGICPFGEDDGHPRHVNASLVDKICSIFIEVYCPWLA